MVLAAMLVGLRVRAVRAAGASAGGRRHDGPSHDHHRHPQRGDRQDARRAELPPRAAATAPSSRRAMAGGKGVNVARALKALGQPVIATGVAGGPDRHAHHRAAHRGGDPQRLRAHPGGVAHVDGGGGPHLGRADRDQRARPGGRPPASSSCSCDKLLYLAKGADVCVFCGLASARSSTPGFYAALIGELRTPRRHHRARLGGRAAAACHCAPSPTVVTPNEIEAEELVGHEFADEEDRLVGRCARSPSWAPARRS